MSISRRNTLALIGGGAVAAASAYVGWEVTRDPATALLPWSQAGAPQDADSDENGHRFRSKAATPSD